MAAPAALQFARQLDPLCLAAGQLGRGLAEPQVAEAHVEQGAEAADGGRDVGEELRRPLHGQVQHLGDVPAPVRHFERRGVVAGTTAVGAGRVRARQEQQLDADETLALTGLAAPTGDVEGEAPDTVPARPRLLRFGEHLAYDVEQAGVRGQVGTRGAPDGLLVDPDQPVHPLKFLRQLADERGLSGT